MSGAEVARLVRGARALARRQREPLAIRHLEASLADTRPPLDETLRWRVAVHEAGHAIAAHATGLGTPRRIAIHAGGGYVETQNLSTSSTKAEINAALVMLMSGRAAERLFLGMPSAGAGGAEDSDLAKATSLAAAFEVSFGLSDGLIWRGAPKDVDKVLRADPDLRNRVEERLKDAEHQAMAMLDGRKEGLERLAKDLAREGMLDGDRLRGLLASEGTARDKTAQASGCPSGSSGLISP
jgi:ATP-dependent Zn protease